VAPRDWFDQVRRRWWIPAAFVALVVMVALWLSSSGPERITAPRPQLGPDAPPGSDLAAASLSVPVRVSIATLLREVENQVPRTWGSPDEPIEVPERGRTNAAISLRRSPFRAELNGSIARLSATVEYTLEATYDLPLMPDLNLGCGTGEDEPRPRLAVVLEAPITLTSDWRIETRSRVEHVAAASSEERDRCEVTFAGFDVTGRMEEAAREFLGGHTETIDSIVRAAEVRPSFVAWWDVLREPIELDEDVWLEIRPEAIRRGPIHGTGDAVTVDANLRARPRVSVGDRPEVWPTELPALEEGPVGGALDILIEARGEYPAATRLLNEALVGQIVEAAGGRLEVRSLTVMGIGGGRLALETEVAGDLEGRLFLVGTPSYDAQDGQVYIPDLNFSVETSNLLVHGASRALHTQLVTFLRSRARWPVGDAVDWAAEKLREGLNRSLADGVHLEGSVDQVRILGVEARRDALRVRAAGTARATFNVDRGG